MSEDPCLRLAECPKLLVQCAACSRENVLSRMHGGNIALARVPPILPLQGATREFRQIVAHFVDQVDRTQREIGLQPHQGLIAQPFAGGHPCIAAGIVQLFGVSHTAAQHQLSRNLILMQISIVIIRRDRSCCGREWVYILILGVWI